MIDLFFNGQAAWFALPAFVGTFVFALRLVLMVLGASMDVGDVDMAVDFDGDFDVDLGGDVDMNMDTGGALEGDAGSDATFKVLSFQAIAAFLMGFGWGGLGGVLGAEWSFLMSFLVALAAGSGMVWLVTRMMRFMYGMESSGNIHMRSALGREGNVYTTVPPHGNGLGQVQVIIDHRQRTYNASGESDTPIPTGSRVKVVRVNSNGTLTVTPT